MILLYNKKNKDLIINELNNQFKEDKINNNDIQINNNKSNEINNNKIKELTENNKYNKNEYKNKINYKFKKAPNLKYKLDITNTYIKWGFNDIFEIFISYKDNKEYFISPNKNYNLDIFILLNNKIILSFKGHKHDITTIRYFINKKYCKH